jgi:hypothetical protein
VKVRGILGIQVAEQDLMLATGRRVPEPPVKVACREAPPIG